MSEQLDPQEVDRLAAQTEFFRNVKQYAREDVLGQATRQIQARLRDKHNLEAWALSLDELLRYSTNGDFKALVKLKQLECSGLRIAEGRVERMLKQRASQERGADAANHFKDQLGVYGWEFPEGSSTKEITCVLLAAIESHLRAKP